MERRGFIGGLLAFIGLPALTNILSPGRVDVSGSPIIGRHFDMVIVDDISRRDEEVVAAFNPGAHKYQMGFKVSHELIEDDLYEVISRYRPTRAKGGYAGVERYRRKLGV